MQKTDGELREDKHENARLLQECVRRTSGCHTWQSVYLPSDGGCLSNAFGRLVQVVAARQILETNVEEESAKELVSEEGIRKLCDELVEANSLLCSELCANLMSGDVLGGAQISIAMSKRPLVLRMILTKVYGHFVAIDLEEADATLRLYLGRAGALMVNVMNTRAINATDSMHYLANFDESCAQPDIQESNIVAKSRK
eukprot:Skav217383  [mRNA]  locus=scaffold532:28700:30319:- [translate_table: standard]